VPLLQVHNSVHRTPSSGDEAAEQDCTDVHGVLPEQATILEVVPFMSIVDSELIMVAELAFD